MAKKEQTVSYGINSEMAGHKIVEGVTVVQAADDIFPRVKEQAMELAVNGEFIQFENIVELQNKLASAAKSGFNIHVYDEIIGG